MKFLIHIRANFFKLRCFEWKTPPLVMSEARSSVTMDRIIEIIRGKVSMVSRRCDNRVFVVMSRIEYLTDSFQGMFSRWSI